MASDNEVPTQRALAWAHGVFSVQSLGGMLGPTLFTLPDGRQIAPFHIAPWADEPASAALPGILRRLRGEWPCVPFGGDADRAASGRWPAAHATADVDNHGFGSNHDWQWLEPASPAQIVLAIEYPADHAIARLERRVSPDPNHCALDFELAVVVRRACRLPIGLHPCFRLPTMVGGMRIEAGDDIAAATLPDDGGAASIFAPGQLVEKWRTVRGHDGAPVDPGRVPFDAPSAGLLQLLGVPGHIALHNTVEGYRAHLRWEAAHFPSVLLWYSNFGRQSAPWNGRHLALGVEPICSAFDLGPQISAADNPISARGIATARQFAAGETFVTRYRIEVEAG